MLLRGLTLLILFQLAGTALSRLLVPALPGPILGMLLLFAFLAARGQVGEPLQQAASALLRYLPLLLVPPAVGVMAYTADIARQFWAVIGALTLSLALSLAFTAWLMQALIRRQARRRERV